MRYPPPPWRLAGPCAVVTGLIAVEAVRERVPDDLAIIEIRPGKTLASIVVADYQHRATFPYAELAVMPAVVRYRRVRGPWISDIWVNSRASLEGGRQMWGLGKVHADFSWSFGGTTSVSAVDGDGSLASWSWTPPARLVPYPGWFRGVGSVGGDRRSYRGRGWAWLAKTPVSFQPADGTALADIFGALQRPVWMAGRLDISFGDIRVLAPPAQPPGDEVTRPDAAPDAQAI